MIELKNLHKAFGSKQVLNGINLTIPTGATMCIIGKSGCGKSVLLKHIVGLLKQDQGDVLIDGKSVATMSKHNLFTIRKKIGYVFQGAALFDSMTVYQNVIISLYEHGERDQDILNIEARRALASVGLLPDFTENGTPNFEKEFAILSINKPSDLSGGMKKRVSVARALVGSPDYIFYDEPTTGLDPVNSEQIDKLILELSKKLSITSLVITHDMFSVFNIADHVAMLDKGLICFEGDAHQLQSTENPTVTEFIKRFRLEARMQ